MGCASTKALVLRAARQLKPGGGSGAAAGARQGPDASAGSAAASADLGPDSKQELKALNARLLSVVKRIAFCEPGHRITADLTEDLRRAAARISSGEEVSPEEFESNEVPDSEPPPPLSELAKVGLLGCGGFGRVDLLAERGGGGRTFAVKVISKGYTVKTGMQQSVCNERLILLIVRSPFVVSFFGSYNSDHTISLVLEPLLGGELYGTYNRKGFHGKHDHARYYIASISLAVEHLHSLRIVCRGIKPEDCCLDSRGRLKLVDLGLSKLVAGLTYTTCGTPDYFAPELIASTGHSFPLDWWCLGILCFELLAGHPPFESAYPMQIYSKVMKGIQKVTFPASLEEAKGLILDMCHKDPALRLPLRRGGVANLRGHKWYSGFDWRALENQTMQPPYLPIVNGNTDLSNISASLEDAPSTIEFRGASDGWDKEFGPLTTQESVEVEQDKSELEDDNHESTPEGDGAPYSVRVVPIAVSSSVDDDAENIIQATVL